MISHRSIIDYKPFLDENLWPPKDSQSFESNENFQNERNSTSDDAKETTLREEMPRCFTMLTLSGQTKMPKFRVNRSGVY